ncbi:hypothetical protein IU449_11405 [Nocardia higoensis]|uniref:Uncharacterized protein n=1 Tax=Nocardia higoensis TaxID=228599 RepID=A0ABS0DDZ6_9NOCA|nr:hypothetical protein [Nocardia higoensis]
MVTSEPDYVHADDARVETMCKVRVIGLDYSRAVELLRLHSNCVADECDVHLACAVHVADWLYGR